MTTSGKNIFVVLFALTAQYAMYSSADNGETWTKGSVAPNASVIGVTSFKNKLFAGTNNGLYESTDDGVHWTPDQRIAEKNIQSLASNGERMLVWSHNGSGNIFYSSTDGSKWSMLEDKEVELEAREVHGNNFVARRCQSSVNYYDGRRKCMSNHLQILSKNGKKWEDVEVRARELVFAGDSIYAITAAITQNRKKEVGYEREILMSDDRGRSWKKVDENTDPFVLSNYEMQEKLTNLKVWEPIEILERQTLLKNMKLAEEQYAIARGKALKAKRELDAKYERNYQSSTRSGTMTSPKAPDYRALSNDRFNSMHNTKSYIDSKGGIHIR